VLVDLPKDILQSVTSVLPHEIWPPALDLPGYRPVTRPHAKQVREAAKMISARERKMKKKKKKEKNKKRSAAQAKLPDKQCY